VKTNAKAKSKPAPQDALDNAVANAIATVKADIATKDAANAPADAYAEANPHGEALQPGNPKKRAAKALKAAKVASTPTTPAPEIKVVIDGTNNTPETLAAGQLNVAVEITPHLDPESGLWIPKNPNAGLTKEQQLEKQSTTFLKTKKPPKPLKEVTGQPSRGPNSTTAVVSMKVPLKTALAKAATSNMRSLSAQAALYILEGLKRDGIIQDHPPMTEAVLAATVAA
jgi:hypothetical protein